MISGERADNLPSRPVSSTLINRLLSTGNPVYGLYTLGFFVLIWLLLTGDDWKSWLVGLPVVVMASWSVLRLRASADGRFYFVGLLKFIPYFIWESVLGGIDVASRVMRPKMRIAPGFIDYRMRLTQPSARRLFVNSLSLLPGTLAADLDEECLRIHALDRGVGLKDEIVRLERMVSAVYGERL
jgi:multicomponent Na+:H+ antiporter subunit E